MSLLISIRSGIETSFIYYHHRDTEEQRRKILLDIILKPKEFFFGFILWSPCALCLCGECLYFLGPWRWQATQWLGSISRRGGISTGQGSNLYGQRVWKLQPGGGLMGWEPLLQMIRFRSRVGSVWVGESRACV